MKYALFSTIFWLVIWTSCQKPEPSASHPKYEPKRTWQDVLAKAEKYGIADSFRIESENNALMFDSEESLEKYFENEKKVFERKKQSFRYIEEGKKVQCLSDYFRVLDSYPERWMRIYKTEENYAALKKEYFASNYRFFINEEGAKFAVPFLMVVTKPDEMPDRKAREIPNR